MLGELCHVYLLYVFIFFNSGELYCVCVCVRVFVCERVCTCVRVASGKRSVMDSTGSPIN
jgi:hypothetical protein